MKANNKLYCFILIVLWHVNIYGQLGTIGNENCYCDEDTTGYTSKSFFSENSRWLPNKGVIRVFVVFAEALNDPHYNDFDARWPAGQMPANASSYFDADFDPNNIQGYITKYHYQASFGEFIVLGDYYPELVQIEHQGNGILKIIEYLNNKPGNDIITANGKSINSNDFDMWKSPQIQTYGEPKINEADGLIDFIVIIWRRNSGISTTDNSGSVSCKSTMNQIKNKQGFMGYTQFVSFFSSANTIIRHEMAHCLYGSDNFHTGGAGADRRTFMSSVGGYSNLSSWDNNSPVYNAWDRDRMGWTSNHYNPEGQRIQASRVRSDITKDDGNKTFVLRDFVTTGDAVRIKLPYLQSDSEDVFNQYIWLENHQMLSGNIDHNQNTTKGIYAYVQVGKDNKFDSYYNSDSSPNNYTNPLCGFGNYDFDFKVGTNNRLILIVNTNLANPFSGYHFLMRQAYDINNTSDNTILASELFLANEVVIDSEILNSSFFNYGTYPVFGTKFDAFSQGRKISISSNPSSASILTYKSPTQTSNTFNDTPAATDNRKIYLSGLSIKMLKQHTNGNIEVSVSWDDYDVDNDVRWCGDILLKEKINLISGNTIALDQGLTPTQPVIDPISGEFAKPTVFTCEAGSEFILQENSSVVVKNKSALRLKAGSVMEIKNGASLVIETGSKIRIDPCARLIIHGNGKLFAQADAILMISEGAIIAVDKGLLENVPYPQEGSWEIVQGFVSPFNIIPLRTEINANETITWSGKNYYANNIVVNSGGTLKISNESTIFFGSEESKIIVHRGGKLEVENSTLSSTCGKVWEGIVVYGTSRSSQTFNVQGSILMGNNSFIENSTIGISSGTASNSRFNGGIVQVNNTTFRNNKQNAAFYPYINVNSLGQEINNISYFSNCTFITDSETLNRTHSHNVRMRGVKGVRFTNCNVKDVRSNIANARNGIYAENSSFYVGNSNFEKLRYGIYAISSSTDHSFKVLSSTFSALHGIYFNSMDNVQIINNTFNIYPSCEDPENIAYKWPYGVYIDYSQNFKIENNTLLGISNENHECKTVGLLARNTGSFTNELYRNYFENVTVGIQAIGNNRGVKIGQVLN